MIYSRVRFYSHPRNIRAVYPNVWLGIITANEPLCRLFQGPGLKTRRWFGLLSEGSAPKRRDLP